MNDDYRLSENIAIFLNQGYLIEDILQLCQAVSKNPNINSIKKALNEGYSLDEAIIQSNFNHLFIEFFKFFRLDNNISKAILQSLKIWKKMSETKTKLKKQLTYPCILIIFLVAFSIFIVYGLLPSVSQLFLEFDITPGFFTNLIFTLFKIIPILIIFAILILIIASSITIYAIKKQYYQLLDFLVQHVFITKATIQKYYSLKFALYYNELLEIGYDSTDIIVMLYQKIDDSDIKMLIYEIYLKILEGEDLEKIISEFIYFEPLLVTCFKLLYHDNRKQKSMSNYLTLSLDNLNHHISKIIKIAVVFVYCFTAVFVIMVYVSIIIPMMNVVNNL